MSHITVAEIRAVGPVVRLVNCGLGVTCPRSVTKRSNDFDLIPTHPLGREPVESVELSFGVTNQCISQKMSKICKTSKLTIGNFSDLKILFRLNEVAIRNNSAWKTLPKRESRVISAQSTVSMLCKLNFSKN